MARRHSELVSGGAAARQLGVSLSTIWRRIRRGELPSVRVHGRRQIPQASLRQPAPGDELDAIPPFTKDNPIFRMIGIGRSGGVKPDSSDKYAVLAVEVDRWHEPAPPPYGRRRRSR